MTPTLTITPSAARRMWNGRRFHKPMTKDEIERKNKELSNMAGMIQNSHPAQQAQLLPYRGLIGAIGAIGQFPF